MTVVHLRPPVSHRDDPAPFRLGVNYWPAAKGVTLWKNFDIDEVHGDMNTIAELGLDIVRVFLTWEDFQPDPEGVKCCSLARLTALCDAVAAEGLKAIVTLNVGYFGGHNWVPAWLLDNQAEPLSSQPIVSMGRRVAGGYRNPYTDPVARKAAARLARAVGKTLSDHQAVWAYDLGNEPDQFAGTAGSAVIADWYAEMVDALRTFDQKHEITCGIGLHGLLSVEPNRDTGASAEPSFSSLQLDATGLSLARSFLDSDLLPFGCALSTSISKKPCLALDWSVATGATVASAPAALLATKVHGWVASEEAAASFAEELLPKILEVGALGALVGNFTDIEPSLYELPPYDTRELERHRGLLRFDGSLKPHGEVIRRFSESNPIVNANPGKRAAIAVSAEELIRDPYEHTRRLYGTFVAQTPGYIRGHVG